MRRLGWRLPFFASAFLFALVALVPLRLAITATGLEEKGLSAREAAGSVWFGALGEARFGSLGLGDVAARLRFLPLLVGRARLDLEGEGGMSGGLGVSRHLFAAEDVSGSFDAMPIAALPPMRLDLTDLSFTFRDGICASADGRVTARLAGELAGAPLASSFGGEPRCEGPALLLPLASQAGTERIALRVFAGGRYRADLSLVRSGAPVSTRFEGTF